jgi:hypothetical protein
MRHASWSPWLLLLVGAGAVSGCAQMSSAGFTHGQSAIAVAQTDPRYVANPYTAPEKRRAGNRDGSRAVSNVPLAAAPLPETARREEPVVTATASIRTSELQQPAGRPVTDAPENTTRRSLFDKQPWEVELDHVVRGICRGC